MAVTMNAATSERARSSVFDPRLAVVSSGGTNRGSRLLVGRPLCVRMKIRELKAYAGRATAEQSRLVAQITSEQAKKINTRGNLSPINPGGHYIVTTMRLFCRNDPELRAVVPAFP
jgi:hypothetical protein